MKKQAILLLLLTALLPNAWANTPEEKGLAISVEADKRNSGWGDQQANMIMTLRNRHGDESKRNIRSKTLEIENDGDKNLSIFNEPRDIKGTAFLSFTHANKPDDQWLYLPALRRVKRISSANKSGPFMGSEFAFEDLTSQEVEKYTYKWLRDEPIDNQDAFVLERYPTYKHSGYKRQIVWIDQTMYQPVKLEFYDRKNTLLKTLVFADYKQYQGKFWRASRMEMINHQTGKSTTLQWTDYQFGSGLRSKDFNRNSLKRAR